MTFTLDAEVAAASPRRLEARAPGLLADIERGGYLA
jgi:hypothetical protein